MSTQTLTKPKTDARIADDFDHYMDCHRPGYAMCGISLEGAKTSYTNPVCIVCEEFSYCDCCCDACSHVHNYGEWLTT